MQILPRRCLCIAHRGASEYAPENTLTAIVKAAELGADMVELDVQNSADGIPVIIHAEDLSQRTNGSGRVTQHKLTYLKTLDAGDGETIPTLDEAIVCCLEHDLNLYLEIKSESVIHSMVESIQEHNILDRVIISSFHTDWISCARELNPNLVTSIIFDSVTINAVKLAQSVGAQYVHPAWEWHSAEPHKLLTKEWLNNVRSAGLGIISWHEERLLVLRELVKLGLDGICTNTPDVLTAIFEKH